MPSPADENAERKKKKKLQRLQQLNSNATDYSHKHCWLHPLMLYVLQRIHDTLRALTASSFFGTFTISLTSQIFIGLNLCSQKCIACFSTSNSQIWCVKKIVHLADDVSRISINILSSNYGDDKFDNILNQKEDYVLLSGG
jgi:hypothetical protein